MSLRSMFSRGREGYLGLDISDSSLEAVQLMGVEGSKNYRIKGWSRSTIEAGAVKNGRILNPDVFFESLRQLLASPKYGSLDSHSLILSIPEHQSYHVSFRLKGVQPLNTFNQVQEKVMDAIPFEPKEVYWDWKLVYKQKNFSYFYAVAADRAVVDEYIQAFKKGGLKVAAVEPQIMSASRFLWQELPLSEPAIYLDIGSYDTVVASIDDLGIHQSSVVDTGASLWREQLAKKLKSDAATTSKILRAIGVRNIKHAKVAIIHEVLFEGITKILKEVRQHMTYYHSQEHIEEKVIKQLIVSGGGAAIPGIGELLAKELKLTLSLSHPWASFSPELQPVEFLLLTNSLGAAMRGVYGSDAPKAGLNLLSTSRSIDSKKKRWWRKK